jgi:hypothetical protein
MGLADWFKAARALAPPADVRAALIDAVEAKNSRVVSALFRSHHDEIRASFAAWATVPIDMRNDQEALASYGEMLITVARLFEQEGDEGPMQSLHGDPVANPINDWNGTIAAAQLLSDQHRHAEAAAALSALLAAMDGVRGSAIDFYRPRVLGKLGVALYQAGDRARARAVTIEAQEFCRRIGDEEGVAAYTANLENMTGD